MARGTGDSVDIVARVLPPLAWGEEEASSSLEAVYDHVVGLATDAIRWYLVAKRSKKRWAQRLRVSAILGVAVAGILPVLSQISGEGTIEPAWATVVLAGAVTLVVLDRFFGFSSAWARYMSTEVAIRGTLNEFQLAWEQRLAQLSIAAVPFDVIGEMLESARAFAVKVDDLVHAETAEWVSEFSESLKEIEKAAEKARQ